MKNLKSAECATEPLSFGVDLRVDRARIEEPIDEPGRRAVGEPLELGDVERRLRPELLEHERMRQLRRAAERAERALEAALPAVRARKRVGAVAVARRELGERAKTLTLGRRLLELPRQRRQRPAARPAANVLRRRRRACTSSQNGLGSRGLPSSVAASRTR